MSIFCQFCFRMELYSIYRIILMLYCHYYLILCLAYYF